MHSLDDTSSGSTCPNCGADDFHGFCHHCQYGFGMRCLRWGKADEKLQVSREIERQISGGGIQRWVWACFLRCCLGLPILTWDAARLGSLGRIVEDWGLKIGKFMCLVDLRYSGHSQFMQEEWKSLFSMCQSLDCARKLREKIVDC